MQLRLMIRPASKSFCLRVQLKTFESNKLLVHVLKLPYR
jgi:hypothetical protein